MPTDEAYDLSTADGVLRYLRGTPFSSSRVTPLTGGFGNFTFRLSLDVPFHGSCTVILKHAKPYVALNPSIPFNPERQVFEAECLKKVRGLLVEDSLITAPVLRHFDQDANVIIMDDCGEAASTLKELVLSNALTPSTGSQIGREIGKFLARIHSQNANTKDLCNTLDANEQGRKMSAWVTYGRLIDTLSGNSKLPLLPAPAEVAASDLEFIRGLAGRTIERINTAHGTVTHGDFWPGNILVKLGTSESGEQVVEGIFVVDWEMAKPGIPGLDLGQAFAEVHLLQRFHPQVKDVAASLLSGITETYSSLIPVNEQLVRDAATHVGAHLVAVTPRVPWGTAEKTGEVVEEGTQWLLKSNPMATELYLPQTLPFPIKIVSLDVSNSASVDRGTRLLSYSFEYTGSGPDPKRETRYGTWDSTIEGTLEGWKVRRGEVVTKERARGKPVVAIVEPCTHGVQIHGMCGLCGKDMTDHDYTGFSDAARAHIQMTHLANGPTVSLQEAQRLERETADHLLKSRKLSLIVDLDQTIVHATVDPTVGEWIAEGEAWEARQAQKAASGKEKGSDGSDSDSDEEDEVNPNWEALKDVKKFRLAPEILGTPRFKGPKSKTKVIEDEGCLYYIKPRPGWHEFLHTLSEKYEMHVYTMGTRAYAEEVCKAIDPEGQIFGNRILSRDESGSLTQKSLQRLFPCDTSMVVIIDDRADVWEWSPNLIKVIPYDFFVGIGDINSAFLPKLDPVAAVPVSETATAAKAEPAVADSGAVIDDSTTQETAEADGDATTKDEMLTQNTLALEAQVEERPLAKKQEELQSDETIESGVPLSTINFATADEGQPQGQSSAKEDGDVRVKKEKHVRKALLRNDDVELQRVRRLLEQVHSTFYADYDASKKKTDNLSVPKRKQRTQETLPYDVKLIIPRLRSNVFDGVHLVFSGVIPLESNNMPIDPEATEIWRTAIRFGARCYKEMNEAVTHVVATPEGVERRTSKINTARARGIPVVSISWFHDSVALWQRLDERPYSFDLRSVAEQNGPASASSPFVDQQSSSDIEPDTDDWDSDVERTAPQSAEAAQGEPLLLDAVAWDDINDEVEAAMMESDDEDIRTEGGVKNADASEDEGSESNSTTSSATSTPRRKRKRLRSLTPSELGMNGNNAHDLLRSPLSKRKKLAADRESKLKEEVSVEELENGNGDQRSTDGVSDASRLGDDDQSDDDAEGDDEADQEIDEDLLRELGEDWG
ncbi:hypothetical protein PUNSTDRAFT_95201 [Punctularia strigosozonata HHB-11173 SS5]|uniref:uncharacterized protein n=1 Tax=Punctularia strigosozonata (strain HHB-11173) TaxID=741275 RepID=UPI0004416941|nr:uncharacterized protein PUNSTDRAFT_95201 [Punctularia strigosozonata HHB-11173 SS5]EIN13841.1 hypothetical protein PUNSTDRAFT_95201 [Punctularia strigosozonata HHB-11173 SS5]